MSELTDEEIDWGEPSEVEDEPDYDDPLYGHDFDDDDEKEQPK